LHADPPHPDKVEPPAYNIEDGKVDLLIQRTTAVGRVGDVISVPVAVYGNNEPFTVADLVLTWDPEVLTLATEPGDGHWLERYTVADAGPYPWLINGFLADSNADAWNNSIEDGDAWYTAWAAFDSFPRATVDGLLIGDFEFRILGPPEGTPPGRPGFTTINFIRGPADDGARPKYSWTDVYDEEVGNVSILRKTAWGMRVAILP
jgi:hypothetical protein